MLQPQHFINASTNPEGCHLSNFIRQNEVIMANEPLKVQQSLVESVAGGRQLWQLVFDCLQPL